MTYKYLHKYAQNEVLYVVYVRLDRWPAQCTVCTVHFALCNVHCTAPPGLDTKESHSHKPHNCPAIMMIIIIIDH